MTDNTTNSGSAENGSAGQAQPEGQQAQQQPAGQAQPGTPQAPVQPDINQAPVQPGAQQAPAQPGAPQTQAQPAAQAPYGQQAPAQPGAQQAPYGQQVPGQQGAQMPYGQQPPMQPGTQPYPMQPGMQAPYGQQTQEKQPWYGKTWAVILFLIIFWPVGLVLMWKKTCKWSKVAKIIVTVVLAVWVVGNIAWSVSQVSQLEQQYASSAYTSSSTYSSSSSSSSSSSASDSSSSSASDSSTAASSGSVETTTQATPAPEEGTFAADLEAAGTFDTVVVKGTGNAVVDLPNPNCLVQAKYTGDSNFVIWATDTNGDDCGLLVNAIGDYEGTATTYITYNSDQEPAQLSVESYSDGEWELTITPLSQMEPLENGKTYTNGQVLYFTEPMDNVTFTMRSTSGYSDTLEVYAVGMDTAALVVEDYGDEVSETVSWTDTPGFFVVNTTGEWSASW